MEVKVKSIVSRELDIDNHDDSSRQYDIKANVTFRGAEISAVSSGVLTATDGRAVSFGSYNGLNNLRMEFKGFTDRTSAVEAIEEFMDSARALVNSESQAL